jgi:hypothetical protein
MDAVIAKHKKKPEVKKVETAEARQPAAQVSSPVLKESKDAQPEPAPANSPKAESSESPGTAPSKD